MAQFNRSKLLTCQDSPSLDHDTQAELQQRQRQDTNNSAESNGGVVAVAPKQAPPPTWIHDLFQVKTLHSNLYSSRNGPISLPCVRSVIEKVIAPCLATCRSLAGAVPSHTSVSYDCACSSPCADCFMFLMGPRQYLLTP